MRDDDTKKPALSGWKTILANCLTFAALIGLIIATILYVWRVWG